MKSGGSRQPAVNNKSSQSQRPSSSSRAAGGGEACPEPKRDASGLKRKEAPTTDRGEARATKSKVEAGGSRPAGKEAAAAAAAAASKKAFGISDDTVVVEMDDHGHYYREKEFPYNHEFMAKARDRYDRHVQERTDRKPFVLKFQDDYIDFGNGDESD